MYLDTVFRAPCLIENETIVLFIINADEIGNVLTAMCRLLAKSSHISNDSGIMSTLQRAREIESSLEQIRTSSQVHTSSKSTLTPSGPNCYRVLRIVFSGHLN